jgi:NADPH:quinone reductase-like Zn-dependent oxidoreductase
MQAVVQSRYGPFDQVLQLREIDKPAIGDDEVLVRVRAASMHPDIWHAVTGLPQIFRLMTGLRKPKHPVPGTDLAGQVEAAGKRVTRFKPGDEVFGDVTMPALRNGGTYAEYAAVKEDALVAKPGNVTFEQAGSIPTSGFIASHIAGQLKPGQHALINGAGGCVGSIAVQLAKADGAMVTGVDCAERLEMIRALGADRVIDYRREDVTKSSQRYDYILDVASTLSFKDCKHILTPDGVYNLIGHAHYGRVGGRLLGVVPQFAALMLRAPFDRNLPKLDFKALPGKQAILSRLKTLLETGKLTPTVARTFSLAEVPAAMRCMIDGQVTGRIVITP